MSDSLSAPLFDQWLSALQAWTPAGIAAPQQLSQSILQGWSLISVNENNSASPETEKAIVAKASYGRQLGRVIDALEQLLAERPKGAAEKSAYTDLHLLAEEIATAKKNAAKSRIDHLIADLSLLKREAPTEYARQKAALLAALERD